MCPESDKPNLLPKALDRAGESVPAHQLRYAAWTTDPETGERVPEPERVSKDEEERMARANRIRFEAVKAEDRARQTADSVAEGLRREMHRAIDAGVDISGTVLFAGTMREKGKLAFRWVPNTRGSATKL